MLDTAFSGFHSLMLYRTCSVVPLIGMFVIGKIHNEVAYCIAAFA